MTKTTWVLWMASVLCVVLAHDASGQIEWNAERPGWQDEPVESRREYDPESIEGRYYLAFDLMGRGEFKKARTLLMDLIEEHPRTVLRDKIELRIAECYYHEKEYVDAYDQVSRIVLPSGHPMAKDVLELKVSIAEALLHGGRQRILGFIQVDGAPLGITILRRLVDSNPQGPYADDALFMLSDAYFKRKQYDQAAMNFEFLVKNYPKSAFAAESAFLANRSLFLSSEGPEYDAQPLIEARDGYRIMLRKVTEGELAEQARDDLKKIDDTLAEKLWKIAEFYHTKREGPSAATYYQTLLRRYPDSKYATDATKRLDELTQLSARRPEPQTKEE